MDPLLRVETKPCVYIPMRDGVHLAANLYRPAKAGRYPAILSRTPYGRAAKDAGEFFAARGYVYLAAEGRGSGSSEGRYTYYNIHEGMTDGYDLVEWLAAQDFCDGNVGTCGGSAGGIYQILTGCMRPPHLRCMSAAAYPLDFYTDQWYPGGVLRLANRIGWCQGVGNGRCGPDAVFQDRREDISDEAYQRQRRVHADRFTAMEHNLRHAPMGALHWASDCFNNPIRTAVWDAIDLTERIRQIDIPVLHTGVIYDHFGIGTVRGYQLHPGPKRLIMVPGSLGFEAPYEDAASYHNDLEWFDHYLKGRPLDVLTPRVSYYCTGAGSWLHFDGMPPTRPMPLHLAQGDLLATQPPSPSTALPHLTHDPSRPLASPRTPEETGAFGSQAGAVTFATAPLDKPLTVVGEAQLRLALRTDMPDANIVGWICAVGREGKIRRLNFGARKLTLRESYACSAALPKGPFEAGVPFWTVSHRFDAGERLAITLSLSDHPFFENSPHAGRLDLLGGTLSLPALPG